MIFEVNVVHDGMLLHVLGIACYKIVLYGVKTQIDGRLQSKGNGWVQYANHHPHPSTVLLT